MSGSDAERPAVAGRTVRRRLPGVRWVAVLTTLTAALAVTACGGSSGGSSANSGVNAGAAVNGGTLTAAIPDNPDHLDSGLSYATEGWELLEATGDGLLTFKRTSGAAGAQIVPDIATRMPTVTDGGRTYTFHLHTDVHFSPPVNRAVQPTDIKYTIERLFRIDSGGVGFYTGIAGASRYQKTHRGGISGIVADDHAHTISFHLTAADGTFLEYMAIPFAFAVPAGTPDHDISTEPRWRAATGPYMVSSYQPGNEITLVRNPNFRRWTPNTPNGHLNRIDITIGTTPESAVNETADGQLDWYFEAVPTDRLTQLRAQHPDQVHIYPRNDITYFLMNLRKAPFNNLKVRQAVNLATNRNALLKIFGAQGTPTENIIPPTMGSAYRRQWPYPYDLAKAKSLVNASGTKGMAVQVWSHSTPPAPQAAEYMASVLGSLGYHATVKTENESVYWDTISTEKGDPQMAFVQFDQDYPEGQDFIDIQLNGEHITNVGNQDTSNFDDPAINRQIDAARAMQLGPARNARWSALDREIMTKAPWVPFINRDLPKFVSPELHGLVFNGTYYEMFPDMWLSK